ncbi:MAG: lanthionine synthetase LanC family protein, partial [Acidobacteriota bacterium]
MTTQDFLHAAAHIGQRIVRRAQWRDRACTWEVVLSRRATLEPATGEIYQGTSGIALFLGELFHRTAEADLARTAQGAMAHAFAAAPDLPPGRFGFYTGRVGIALAAARLAPLLRRDDYLEEALDLLQPMAGHEDQIEGADVMAGAAGAIPALIGLAELLASDLPLTLAEALGEHLIDTAHREPG